jgi:hypothetical protein
MPIITAFLALKNESDRGVPHEFVRPGRKGPHKSPSDFDPPRVLGWPPIDTAAYDSELSVVATFAARKLLNLSVVLVAQTSQIMYCVFTTASATLDMVDNRCTGTTAGHNTYAVINR